MTSPSKEGFEKPTDAAEYDISIGEVMTQQYVSVTKNTAVGDAIKKFRDYTPEDPERSTIYYVYVVDKQENLVGVCSVRKLLNTPEDQPVSSIMKTDLISFNIDADAEEVAVDVSEYHFPAIPITDNENKLVGIVRSEQLIEVVQETLTEDLLKLQGMDLPEPTDFTEIETKRSTLMLDAPIHQILRIRVPWLVVALAGGFLAGGVIGVFEEALETVVLLAIFIPVIMDMGGNVGTQSSTIFVRGTALGQIGEQNVKRHIMKEGLVGLLIGVLVGSLAGIAAYLWKGMPELGIVIFLSLTLTCIIASMIGYGIPWIAHKLGYDPAAVSDPFITTIKDVTALLIYFSLAAALVPMI